MKHSVRNRITLEDDMKKFWPNFELLEEFNLCGKIVTSYVAFGFLLVSSKTK